MKAIKLVSTLVIQLCFFFSRSRAAPVSPDEVKRFLKNYNKLLRPSFGSSADEVHLKIKIKRLNQVDVAKSTFSINFAILTACTIFDQFNTFRA
jgi:hypothetical protein